ncbi:hypothetical protein COO72_10515 [Bifidobacterium callitrichos]|nr:hypothetical protein COO72_10515 [Bifidobacterium callitrichos]
MGTVVLADELVPLVPDPAWDIKGLHELVGGIMAVCILLAVAMIILGLISMLPGMVTNNMMERAFSWKRLLAALMIPIIIGSGSGAMQWGYTVFGTGGLSPSGRYQDANGKLSTDGDSQSEHHSDDLTDLIQQLGKDIADRIASSATDAIKKLGDAAASVGSAIGKGFDTIKNAISGFLGGGGGSTGDSSKGNGFDGGGGGSGGGQSGGR